MESNRTRRDRKAQENARHQIAFRSRLDSLNKIIEKYEGKRHRTKNQILDSAIKVLQKRES